MRDLLVAIIALFVLVLLFSHYGWIETEQEQSGEMRAIPSGMAIVGEGNDLVIYEQKPTPQDSNKSNTEIAYEIIYGKWGNGAERKSELTAAGYDYKAVQAIVNDLLA